VLSNQDLERMVDTSDEWIRTRTGIRERRICLPDQAASDLAAESGRKAIEYAKVDPQEIGLLIVATITQDTLCPSTACYVQERLGIKSCVAFDLNAACTGFLYGITLAKAYIQSGMCDKALIIGVDVLSRVTDYEDRATCVLFGDAAGAAVLGPTDEGRGILAEYLSADGKLASLICIPAGGSRLPASAETVQNHQHYIKMSGNEVFKVAVRILEESVIKALEKCNLKPEDLSLVVPHQANTRIIEASARRLNIALEKFYVNIDKYGNTSAASVPLALDEAVRTGRVKSGDLLALVAFGGGFTWGANIIRW
jgi:3-oxoacyl-[acyl-carrier-protein] synthase-3